MWNIIASSTIAFTLLQELRWLGIFCKNIFIMFKLPTKKNAKFLIEFSVKVFEFFISCDMFTYLLIAYCLFVILLLLPLLLMLK